MRWRQENGLVKWSVIWCMGRGRVRTTAYHDTSFNAELVYTCAPPAVPSIHPPMLVLG